jgi:hypothetical protein
MQQQLRIMGAVSGEVKNLPWRDVAMCRSECDAIKMCMKMARVRMSDESWADAIGLVHKTTGKPDASAFSRMINADTNNKPRFLSFSQYKLIQKVAGNRAIEQWYELWESGELDCQKMDDEEAALLAKLAAVRAQKAKA